jgi:hypothetical protein
LVPCERGTNALKAQQIAALERSARSISRPVSLRRQNATFSPRKQTRSANTEIIIHPSLQYVGLTTGNPKVLM